MIRRLLVRNYVLIDRLDVEFPAGLIIITGETGAGKSILLGALSLLLGAKADISMIGSSSENCVVEGEFEVPDTSQARRILDDNDIESQDGTISIRRIINPSGRSRSFVNDCPVPVQLLNELSAYLVDIHSQHQTALLADTAFQMSVIDSYAGNANLVASYQSSFQSYRQILSSIAEMKGKMAAAARDYEYNLSRFKRLQAASLKEGELEELEQEQRQLANAEDIRIALTSSGSMLTSVTYGGEETSVPALMRDASKSLSKLARYIPEMADLSERLESCRLELDDIISEISQYESISDFSEERMEKVSSRLSTIYTLLGNYSCSTVSELIKERDCLEELISDVSEADGKLEEMQKASDTLRLRLSEKAADLSESREKAAKAFAAAVTGIVKGMELPDAVFDAVISRSEYASNGADTVSFRFSATGENLSEISKCASGGERSRIMLAIKSVMGTCTSMPTMIFDEIDTGVSGSVADKMGSVICGMGQSMQVFAITHLPQVAAKGEAHYLVSKSNEHGKTVSAVRKLSPEERVREVARMLSGSVLTEAALANAESLLAGGRS